MKEWAQYARNKKIVGDRLVLTVTLDKREKFDHLLGVLFIMFLAITCLYSWVLSPES